jgi:hypothetical protein
MNLECTDFQLLFDWLLKLAKQLLEKQGSFLPIGAIVLPEGKLGHVAAHPEGEQPGAHKALLQKVSVELRVWPLTRD